MNEDDIGFDSEYIPESEGSYDDSGDYQPTEKTTERDSTVDSITAVAELLAGDSTKADQLSAEGRVNTKSVGNSIDVDANGKMQFGDSTPEPQQQQRQSWDTEVAPSEAQRHVNEMQQAQKEILGHKARIEEMMSRNEISAEEGNSVLHSLGQAYGRAENERLKATVANYENMEMLSRGFAEMQNILGDEAWGTDEARQQSMEAVAGWLKNNNLPNEVLQDVTDPHIASAVIKAARNERDLEAAKAELAITKQALRELKRGRRKGIEQGRKASQVGVKGDKQDVMLNEVMSILENAGKGGKRR